MRRLFRLALRSGIILGAALEIFALSLGNCRRVVRVTRSLDARLLPSVTINKKGELSCLALIPVKALFVDHWERGACAVSDTPHFELVQGLLDGSDRSEGYKQYMELQYGMKPRETRLLTSNFTGLANLYVIRRPKFVIEVTIVDWKYLLVRDGFHRLAIVAANGLEDAILGRVNFCPLSEETVQNRVFQRKLHPPGLIQKYRERILQRAAQTEAHRALK